MAQSRPDAGSDSLVSKPVLHSFQGQDAFVLAACGEQRGGFFLDSGASDGVWGSNTRTLETQYGWKGICIEPNDALYAQLVRNRSCICLNCCLYDRDADVEFFEAAEVYGGIVCEYESGHLEFARTFVSRKQSKPCAMPPEVVRKPAQSIRTLLRSQRAPSVIDYWSLDTEGSELAILRSFPFDEYRVRFLTVEHNHTRSRDAIADFLAGHGLRRVVELGIDDGYAWVGNESGTAWRSQAWIRSSKRHNGGGQ